ncbi:hypothetical protein DPMN_130489 [Dreissena polymorpha]|uniref:Uncharacterized protein n=1 Tax=Dreissena polymorpha TaxID=45954 RepID=A0A9D4H7U4_DREPO|nr:hypothetical protein DPMN_130489 [Dreissena polymorpha]
MAKIYDLGLQHVALVRLELQTSVLKARQDLIYTFQVLLKCFAIYNNIIYIHETGVHLDALKSKLQYSLKCTRSVVKAKRHASHFKLTEFAHERCFWNILLFEGDLKIPRGKIETAEKMCSSYCIEAILYARQGKAIRLD